MACASSTVGIRLASQGLANMYDPNVRSIEDQYRIGDTYTRQIASDSPSSSERMVADATLRAASRTSKYSGECVMDAEFKAIQNGLDGSIGPTLAHVGMQSMYNTNVRGIDDQAEIGRTFTEAVANDSGNRSEQVVSRTALAAGSAVGSRSRQCVMDAELKAIQNGLGGPVGAALATVGSSAMYNTNVCGIDEQSAIGRTFTRAILDNSGSAAEQILSRTSLEAINSLDSQGAQCVEDAALGAVKNGVSGPIDRMLAQVAMKAMYNRNEPSAQDQGHIGEVFARAIRDNTGNQTRRELASAALQSYGQIGDPYARLDVLKHFLDQVK